MAVGEQITIDGKRAPAPAPARGGGGFGGPGGPGGPGGAGRGPGAPGGGRAAQQQSTDPKMRAPGNGTVFVGTKGWLATAARGEGVWLLPAARWADYKLPPQLLPRGVNHQQDWLRACKGGTPGVSEFAVTSKYLEWLALGTIAYETPGKLMWDGKNMRFTNNAAANKLLSPYVRKGWEMKL